MADKKVLVLGGTGAMGVYLVPELRRLGYCVDVVSLDDVKSDDPGLRYLRLNAKDADVRASLLANGYDGIVDYMIYNTKEFETVYEELLAATKHYIYLSSYRIYAGSHPITEESPRLLDVATDPVYLASDDYSLFKARGENLLRASKYRNWTIVRPAITYSQRRFQLTTLEANVVVKRAAEGKLVVLPREALDVQATMSWGGDVGRMQALLLFNEKALGETFTVSTSEHRTWREIARYYQELIGLRYVAVSEDDFLSILTPNGDPKSAASNGHRWQLEYDRLFERVVDNSKVLAVTGMKQSGITSLHDGLARELGRLPEGYDWGPEPYGINVRMDAWLEAHGIE